MGTIAARKAAEILKNTRRVLAIELFAAGQAVSLRGQEHLAPATRAALETLREQVPQICEDVLMQTPIEQSERLVESGALLAAAEAVCGALN